MNCDDDDDDDDDCVSCAVGGASRVGACEHSSQSSVPVSITGR